MVTRRAVLGAAGVAVAGSTTGCLDRLPFVGGESIEFEASPGSVSEPTLQDSGYEERGVEEVVVERTFEAAGQSQDVVVTNWQAEYDKAVDLGDVGLPVDRRLQAAVFTALTTPQVNVLSQTFNPVADMDSEELASEVQGRYEGIDDIRQVGEESGTVAGESTTVGEFEAEAELVEAGITVELTLHIAEAVEAGEDLIVAVGGYPRGLRNREKSPVFTLMEAITYNE